MAASPSRWCRCSPTARSAFRTATACATSTSSTSRSITSPEGSAMQKVVPPKLPIKPHEPMRIAGKHVDDRRARSRCSTPTPARSSAPFRPPSRARSPRLSRSAHAYKPKLTRYERQQILLKTAELLARARRSCRRLITVEFGLCLEGFALRGRPRLRRLLLRRPARHPRRRRDLLLRYHPARQAAQDLHHAHAAAGRDLGDHAVQPSAQHGGAQAGAGHRHQQPRGARSRPS